MAEIRRIVVSEVPTALTEKQLVDAIISVLYHNIILTNDLCHVKMEITSHNVATMLSEKRYEPCGNRNQYYMAADPKETLIALNEIAKLGEFRKNYFHVAGSHDPDPKARFAVFITLQRRQYPNEETFDLTRRIDWRKRVKSTKERVLA